MLIVGGVLLLISALTGILALSAFIQRTAHGAGLLFADVEIFILAAFITLLFGSDDSDREKNKTPGATLKLPPLSLHLFSVHAFVSPFPLRYGHSTTPAHE